MKRVFQAALILAMLAGLEATALSCTCVVDSVGKRYREAKAVFIGQAVNPDEKQPDSSLIQGDRQQTIEVIKSWKGIRKRYVSVSFERVTDAGNCPVLYYLEPGKQYLVVAYGKELEVRSVCSDTWQIPQDKNALAYDSMQSNIKKLNGFWFRFRSRFRLS